MKYLGGAFLKKIRVLFVLLCLIMAIIGLIKVNLLNTKALSPLGNTKENYKKVKNELGKDFSEFITDNASIKIYYDEKNNILVRIGDKNFKIKEESAIIEKAGEVIEIVENCFEDFLDEVS